MFLHCKWQRDVQVEHLALTRIIYNSPLLINSQHPVNGGDRRCVLQEHLLNSLVIYFHPKTIPPELLSKRDPLENNKQAKQRIKHENLSSVVFHVRLRFYNVKTYFVPHCLTVRVLKLCQNLTRPDPTFKGWVGP